ncbi:MarR family transcriptional regulator [Cupriavidus sp. USMAA2-4]|uniref:MarR family winged helix-turn-helix transcriptional regulator n=1 Tax=Cupriavidus sp. USMAA2-4 TaxID=876364 RepID=UPI0008A6696C|nr:MarR family winged helix-turn-helix transcriptional regulator [Cupriavidus sp. USMAA2-4]AOY92091.1 MarR family transcriptional regulator [Cupriavidus sp. USMAA2-4]
MDQARQGQGGGGPADTLRQPATLRQFLNYRLYHLTCAALGASALHLRAAAGVSRREWRMISFLGECPGTRLTELAASAGLDKVLASRAMQALMARGLVRREVGAGDRRAASFALTEAGQAVYRSAFARALDFNTQLASCLDEEEAALLSRCLDKLQAHAAQLLAEAQSLPHAAPAPAGPADAAADPLRLWRGQAPTDFRDSVD